MYGLCLKGWLSNPTDWANPTSSTITSVTFSEGKRFPKPCNSGKNNHHCFRKVPKGTLILFSRVIVFGQDPIHSIQDVNSSPETNSSPLRNGWFLADKPFLFGPFAYFQGRTVSIREGIFSQLHEISEESCLPQSRWRVLVQGDGRKFDSRPGPMFFEDGMFRA